MSFRESGWLGRSQVLGSSVPKYCPEPVQRFPVPVQRFPTWGPQFLEWVRRFPRGPDLCLVATCSAFATALGRWFVQQGSLQAPPSD